MLDDAFAGTISTASPAGVAASAVVEPGRGVVAVKIRWTINETLDRHAPLEILGLRMGEFMAKAAFVGGRKYELAGVEPGGGRMLGFPYNTYYKFRIDARRPYDAAVMIKMPIACWQEDGRAFAIVFPKELTLPRGPAPLFIRADGVGAGIGFSAAIIPDFEVRRKNVGWFGAGSTSATHRVALEAGRSFEADFLLIYADTWVDCVRVCHERLYGKLSESATPSVEVLAEKLETSLAYYNRVWDSRNRTHMHLPVKNETRFESVEFKHSHVTDDLTKLVLYRRLIGLGCSELVAREGALLEKLASGEYLYRHDGAWLWHTTTYFNGGGLSAFTHHGAGFVGFPGGMATVARRLSEYCLLDRNPALEEMALSAADWLVETQGEDGSWPASVEKRGEKAHVGCVAATAESARALISGYKLTGKAEYRNAAEAGIGFLGRDESFFECRQYLRDVDADNFDGLTAEACMHALLDWYSLTGGADALELVEKWALYALQWIRPRCSEYFAEPSFDGLSRSITPRVDVWGGLLIARAFLRFSKAGGEKRWSELAWLLFENIAGLRERDGGFSETWFLDFPMGLQSVLIEPTFVTDAFIEFILDALRVEGGGPLADILNARRESFERGRAPLKPTGEPVSLVSVSSARPEFIIGEAMKLTLAFDGIYDFASRATRTTYTMLRELAPGRALLKLIPAAKIMLNRHRVSPPRAVIGGSCPMEILDFARENSGDGLPAHEFRTPFHAIDLSVVSEGLDSEGLPAADVELTVKTLVGDLSVRQVRLDLGGRYEIFSVHGKKRALLARGANVYSIEVVDGPVDAILRDGDRLAFDVSMCSNWSFFGEYRVRLRITRRPKGPASMRSQE